jgi:hypothetical protein
VTGGNRTPRTSARHADGLAARRRAALELSATLVASPGGGGRGRRRRRRCGRGGRRRSGSWSAGRRARAGWRRGGWARRLRAAPSPSRCAARAGARAARARRQPARTRAPACGRPALRAARAAARRGSARAGRTAAARPADRDRGPAAARRATPPGPPVSSRVSTPTFARLLSRGRRAGPTARQLHARGHEVACRTPFRHGFAIVCLTGPQSQPKCGNHREYGEVTRAGTSAANRPHSLVKGRRLKIVVSPVRVRVSPLGKIPAIVPVFRTLWRPAQAYEFGHKNGHTA